MLNEIIDKAIELLETKGWCQGYYYRDIKGFKTKVSEDSASYCALGSIIKVRYLANGKYSGVNIVDRFQQVHNIDIVAYNDTKGRTKEEVIEALRACKC